jgi:uncharacterized protein (TIRG00374 family)
MSLAARRLALIAPILILGAVLLLFKYIGFPDILKSLQQLRSPAIALIVALRLLGGWIQATKLRVVCRGIARVHWLDSWLVNLGGNFVSTITPGYHIGGEPVRAFYLNTLYGDGKSSFMSLVLLDRFFNLAAIVFYALVALALVFFRYSFNLHEAMSILISLIVVVALVVFVVTFKGAVSSAATRAFLWTAYIVPFSPVRRKHPDREAFARLVSQQSVVFVQTLLNAVRTPWTSPIALTLALLGGFVDYLRVFAIFHLMGHSVDFSAVFIAFTFTEVAARAVGFIPGGLGITEASLVGFFSALDVSAEFAAAATLVERSLFYSLNIGLGYVALVVLHLRLGYQPLSTEPEERIIRSKQGESA